MAERFGEGLDQDGGNNAIARYRSESKSARERDPEGRQVQSTGSVAETE